MTKEQAQEEFIKLLKQKVKEEDRIIEEAKENGLWKQGLDSNNELFIELNNKYNKKIELLKSLIE